MLAATAWSVLALAESPAWEEVGVEVDVPPDPPVQRSTWRPTGQQLGAYAGRGVWRGGDLDSDGRAELVWAGEGRVVVWALNEDGWLVPRGAVLEIPGADEAFALGDIDGDGALDLVLANATPSVWRSDGVGGFVPWRASDVPLGGRAVWTLDADGDGRDELVVQGAPGEPDALWRVEPDGATLSAVAWPEAPRGTAALMPVRPLGSGAGWVARRDASEGGGWWLWSWSGEGAPEGVALALPSAETTPVAAGDLDGDGAADIALMDDAAPEQGLRVCPLGSDGRVGDVCLEAAAPSLDGLGGWSRVRIADVDGDGEADLVAVAMVGDAVTALGLVVWYGDGLGGLTEAEHLPGAYNAPSVVWLDGDGDGDEDVVFAGATQTRLLRYGDRAGIVQWSPPPWSSWLGDDFGISVRVEQGDQAFERLRAGLAHVRATSDIRGQVGLETVEDGVFMRLVLRERLRAGERVTLALVGAPMALGGVGEEAPTSAGPVWSFHARSTRDGARVFVPRGEAPWSGQRVVAGDLNRDGALDVIVGGDAGNAMFTWRGGGAWEAVPLPERFPSQATVRMVDLDSDGDLDLLAQRTLDHALWLNDGRGELEEALSLGWSTETVFLARVESAEAERVVVLRDPFEGLVFAVRREGEWTQTPVASELPGRALRAHVGGLDGDGFQDVVVWTDGGGRVFQGEPEPRWRARSPQRLGAGAWISAAVGDVNGDGLEDIWAIGPEGGQVWLSTGQGWVAGARLDDAVGQHVALGDVDGDGDLDALTSSSLGSASVRMWRGDGDGGFTQARDPLPDVGGQALLIDVDSDGDLDVLTAAGGVLFQERDFSAPAEDVGIRDAGDPDDAGAALEDAAQAEDVAAPRPRSPQPASTSGCACRAVGAPRGGDAWGGVVAWLLALSGLGVWRRRRTRAAQRVLARPSGRAV